LLLNIDDELIGICQKIVDESKSEEDWSEVESCDMFQTPHYEGGFDADEMGFCFSIYIGNDEYWFQLSLDQVHDIVERKLQKIEASLASDV
jgi:hypothetical protein